jgi:hypothetical protein
MSSGDEAYKMRDFHNILAQKVQMTLQFAYDP